LFTVKILKKTRLDYYDSPSLGRGGIISLHKYNLQAHFQYWHDSNRPNCTI